MRVRDGQLIGVREIAEILCVSRQRADQITREKGFPDPVANLAAGRVWLQKDLRDWIKRR